VRSDKQKSSTSFSLFFFSPSNLFFLKSLTERLVEGRGLLNKKGGCRHRVLESTTAVLPEQGTAPWEERFEEAFPKEALQTTYTTVQKFGVT